METYIYENDLKYLSIGYSGSDEYPLVITLDKTHQLKALDCLAKLRQQFVLPDEAIGWVRPIKDNRLSADVISV